MRPNTGSCRVLLFAASFLGSAIDARAQTESPTSPGTTSAGRVVSDEPAEVPTELSSVSSTGLTAVQVAARASNVSFDAVAAEQALAEAAASVDQAWTRYVPRVTASAQYMRYSQLDAASSSHVSVVLAEPGTPTGTPNPSPTSAYQVDLSYRPLLDQYLMETTAVVRISDYFLRYNKEYAAAALSRDAARDDLAAARAQAAAEGEVAFYNWVRCRHAVVAFVESLNEQRAHLRDVRNRRMAGYATDADVLRTETNAVAAEEQVERSIRLAEIAAKEVALAIGAREGEVLRPGEGLDVITRPVTADLRDLVAEALASRPEVASLDAGAEASRRRSQAARAAGLPAISAVGDVLYANPNPRRIQQVPEWDVGWDVGVALVWSPSDFLTSRAEARSSEAHASRLDAMRRQLCKTIELEVTRAYSDLKGLETTIDLARRQVASAIVAQRAARDLFLSNNSPSSVLTDAELELARARLALLNAQADRLIAGVRLAHAIGHVFG